MEDFGVMGDVPQQRQSSQDNFRSHSYDASPHSLASTNTAHKPSSNMEYEGYFPHQIPGTGPSPGGQAMDMRSLAGALPEYANRPFQQQSFPQMGVPGGQSQGLMYQAYPSAQFAGQAGGVMNLNSAQQYSQQYAQSQQPRQGNFFTGASQPFQNPGSQGMVQNMQGHHVQQYLHPQQSSHYGAGFPARGFQQQLRVSPTGPNAYQSSAQQSVTRTSSNSSMKAASSSVLRGPPRKPKQSGHALWVGNLPPGTHILDLKDHFSRDATKDIESVFLISKSNCAFVNYKSEESCQAAMGRFHDSRFQNVRLVCRLRRGSASSAPATPQVTVNPENTPDTPGIEPDIPANPGSVDVQPSATHDKVKEKYFVVKSLTTEDLERSVHSGIWATQAHNETALSNAYESAEDVFLIFSANKSGEYFGYARMESAIGDGEAAAKTEIPPPSTANPPTSNSNLVDVPTTIPTAATPTAPKGRIIDDSSRGTIFWEADPIDLPATAADDATDATVPTAAAAENTLDPDQDQSLQPQSGSGNVSSGEAGYDSGAPSASPGSPGTPQSTSFGKPFKITWISTDRLPFYRTRGLRNPWNANREVKIARDGTEIEPSVGRRLVSMFGQPFQAPPGGPQQVLGPMHGGGGGGYHLGRGMPHPQQLQMQMQPQHQMGAYMGQGGMMGQQGGGGGMMGPGPGPGMGGYGRGY